MPNTLKGEEYFLVDENGKAAVPDVSLRNNDIAFVFSTKTEAAPGQRGEKVVLVLGEVSRRGSYRFASNEPCTIMHLIFKMGGLRKKLPVPFWTFLIGAAALAGFPLITSGFYSKDLILWYAYAGPNGSPMLWFIGLFGAFLTALYSFRLVFVTFFGEAKSHVSKVPGLRIGLPLIILAVLALIGGFVELPHK